ncbi:MAG TPA: TolC family protein, partial [Chitinophagaceae bacterium]|nr:TolC family protein [Chitinophagaceae bacterium]
MKKTFLIIFIGLFAVLRSNGQEKPVTTLSLRQCVETGIAHNLQVQQGGFQMQRQEVDWKQAKLNRYPSLNGSGVYGINQGRSIDPFTNNYINENVNFSNYGLNSDLVLFNGFSRRNSIKQYELGFEASKKDWQQQKDDITINIILAYLQVLSNEDILRQAANQAELTGSQVQRLEVLNREGAIPPSQLSDLRGQYANDQLNIIGAQESLETSKLALCRLMNIPYDKNMVLERLDADSFVGKYEDNPVKIYETALRQFSLVRAAELREQSAEKAVRSIKGELFPTLSLNGTVYSNYSSAARNAVFLNTSDIPSSDYVMVNGTQSPVIYKQNNYRYDKIGYGRQLDNNLYTSFSLRLSVPIFNGLQTRNRVKLAKINLKESTLQNRATKTQLQQDIELAYINMTKASERLKTLLEQVSAYS